MTKNVIVIMSDEHDPRHMGVSGSRIVKTPNLDALAAGGMRFTSAYTPCPICVPARAAFATGMRVHQLRLWDNAMPYHGQFRGWGHVLQERGVRVESVGKLHYRETGDPAGFDVEHLPMHVVGGYGMVWGSIRDPYLHRFDETRMFGTRIGRGESSYTQYDRNVTDLTVDWLEQRAGEQDQPFVLYVGLVAPHFPLIAPDEFYDLYKELQIDKVKQHPKDGFPLHPWVQQYEDFAHNDEQFRDAQERQDAFRAYFGLCSFLDHNVGRIMKTLETTGLSSNTTVIYTSDHGDNLGARGLWGKSTLYEESVRVPMIVSGPGIEPGVCATPVDLLDLYPTILDFSGIDPAPHMQDRPGRSLRRVAADAPQHERLILSEYHAAGSNTAGFMLRQWPWKYHYYVRHEPELFNLRDDPEELTNLAGDPAMRDVLDQMQAQLRAICDPEALDALAKADQEAMIATHGGPEKAASMGAAGATPAPVK